MKNVDIEKRQRAFESATLAKENPIAIKQTGNSSTILPEIGVDVQSSINPGHTPGDDVKYVPLLAHLQKSLNFVDETAREVFSSLDPYEQRRFLDIAREITWWLRDADSVEFGLGLGSIVVRSLPSDPTDSLLEELFPVRLGTGIPILRYENPDFNRD